MSTANTRVLRNVTGFTVVSATLSSTTIQSIMEVRLNDATGELKTGSDNDAAYTKFSNPFEFTGDLVLEDPIQGQPVVGKGGCNVAFQAIDIKNGTNVNVAATGVRFGQVGLSASFGQQGTGSINMSGGQVTFVSA
jgi:hypothetical protein